MAGLDRAQAPVRDYIAVLGLELMFDEAEGYAYLRQRLPLEGETELPRLVGTPTTGSIPVSLLLRYCCAKSWPSTTPAVRTPRLILNRGRIVEMIRVFLPDTGPTRLKLMDQIDAHINKVVELGFLRRRLRGQDADDRNAPHSQSLCRRPVAGRI